MGKMSLTSGRTRDERKERCSKIGTLRENTVGLKARKRYNSAMSTFYAFCQSRKVLIPDKGDSLDEIFSDFIEFLWECRDSLSLVTDALSGLQDLRPHLRGHLNLSWRLVKTWQRLEIPHRVPPLPEDLLHAMCGYFLNLGDAQMSLALETAFYGVLRTGELLQMCAQHISVSSRLDCAVLSLGFTKTSQRTGAADSVTIRLESLCRKLSAWKSRSKPGDKLVPVSDYHFRKAFDSSLTALRMQSWGFRPYSLRRGGATMYFAKNPQMDWLRLMGRWSSDRTVRVYVNDGLAQLAEMRYDIRKPPLHSCYLAFHAQTRLEHASGMSLRGRGKRC